MLPIASEFPVKGRSPVTWSIIALCALIALGQLADGTRVVYVADQATEGYDNLYVVPIGGGASVPVGGAGSLGGEADDRFSRGALGSAWLVVHEGIGRELAMPDGDGVVRKLADSATGWSAVAVGAQGRPGVAAKAAMCLARVHA